MKRSRYIKGLVTAVILIITIVLSGCWNYIELDNRAIVVAVGLDKSENDMISLSVQVVNSNKLNSEGGSDDQAFIMFSAEGRTIFEAVREMTMTSNRKLFWQHNHILIVGEELAIEGIAPYTDFFIRDHESRARTWVIVCEGEAKEMLKKQGAMEKIPAHEIGSLITSRAASSRTAAIYLHDLQVNFTDNNISSLVSWLELAETAEDEDNPVFKLTGAAVFKSDKFVGRLDRLATRGALWITGKVKSGILVVEAPDKEALPVGIEIIKASSKISVEKDGDTFKMLVEISMEGNIGDQYGHSDLSTHKNMQKLELLASDVIENESKLALDKAQKEYSTDIFGFGSAIHRKDSKAWKKMKEDWENIFSQIEIEVIATVQLNRSGFIGGSGHDK